MCPMVLLRTLCAETRMAHSQQAEACIADFAADDFCLHDVSMFLMKIPF